VEDALFYFRRKGQGSVPLLCDPNVDDASTPAPRTHAGQSLNLASPYAGLASSIAAADKKQPPSASSTPASSSASKGQGSRAAAARGRGGAQRGASAKATGAL